ncbi:uncharacterized protein PFL1_02209 [Pseudozyma flocculosa PF-1]|uniref:Related to taurine dioxygenase n=1 Tax=Pseudozyma flocculosa TaxID=84751 RepID=A0A5C3FDJ7_9BASI|nr:uncharacterized protein PFL1_02209 [Pseudozyma flocculosa PF-1]EPQ30092.1 hypothetical protein PFL1_02209 [Pseudozyma flocculosa PF-1]SPO41439.1 related to taurine dioxygenase [Pseudozyma flocculosa]
MAPTADLVTSSAAPIAASAKLASLNIGQGRQASWRKGDLQREPLVLKGLLEQYSHFDVTPVIGREFSTLQIRDVLQADNADELLRELAITISRRGVVFFRDQDLTPEEQKDFTHRVGLAAGKPESSGLHIHPITNAEREGHQITVDEKGTPNTDNEISVISSKMRRELYSHYRRNHDATNEWHSDITFEPAPADYTSLKVHTLPSTGGDTLWSSGYEIFDLLSPQIQAFAETLTGHFAQPAFNEAAARGNFTLYSKPRGSPLNVGEHLSADHPFIRTNPVTGWKSVFGLGSHFRHINGLTPKESELLRNHILELVSTHHLAQVRFKWNKNDVAIWDNRSTFHAATPDYEGLGDRAGVRAVSVGEAPYLDPNSWSRRDELGQDRLI